jgi:hypothetical protein
MTKNMLVGKTIKAINLDVSGDAIQFLLDDESIVKAVADGDCCSHTWIEDVLDPEAAIGSEVLEADDIDLPDHLCEPTKHGHDEDEMEYYGFAIKTAKGVCTIAYRNSSNGYYGGSLSWPGGYFYGGVFGQNGVNESWKLIAGSI